MDVKTLLNQFLSSGSVSTLAEQGKQLLTEAGKASSKNTTMADIGKGALGGSALTLLLSSKKGRKIGKKMLAVGGTIGLGTLAYKAYQDWQQNKTDSHPPAQTTTPAQPAQIENKTQDYLQNTNDTVILQAMIAAAKADGHIDDEEKDKIQKAVQSLGASDQLEQFVQAELNKPLDPADIAAAAKTTEVKTQVYLASLLIVDEQNFMEKAYLQELARQLELAPSLVQSLQEQANSVS